MAPVAGAELGNPGRVAAGKITWFRGGAHTMVQNVSVTLQDDPFAPTLPLRPAREFSATRVIGGSLRALYDHDAQPYPDRLAELLATLKIGSLASH
jgi:hypothetical protein